jgi:hypothetical protein
MRRARTIVKQRPAETTTLASAVAVLIAYVLGLDEPEVVLALAVVLGFVPAVVTWVVEMRRKPG